MVQRAEGGNQLNAYICSLLEVYACRRGGIKEAGEITNYLNSTRDLLGVSMGVTTVRGPRHIAHPDYPTPTYRAA